ncbi:Protein-cysteine N-palmitoyltransferase Rasp [Trachymyrmex cornetzi]|uniref:Protein-cysteine N-palmitoyltransferase Rasp n=1 Tax=Trachymyrmex cornetzi TaxID=471704 RepID=A0A195EC48_9HYME|nr:Protein-cysteine N-palmitoyltransferase Rasp [Trachymyrmex cornetzi]
MQPTSLNYHIRSLTILRFGQSTLRLTQIAITRITYLLDNPRFTDTCQHVSSKRYHQTLCYWYILSSTVFLYYYLGMLGMLCTILQPTFLHIMTCICSRNAVWTIHILYMFVIHILKIPNGPFQSWLGITDEKHYILTLVMCWIHLRSISHNMDNIDDQFSSSNNFVQKLAYCLYLPTLFLGPLILYHEFVGSIKQPHQYWDCQKFLTFMLNLVRYMFWCFFTELLLHFIYVNAIQYQLQVLQNLNSWELFGLGYCMGQFFFNKYVVMYGTCSNLCYLDDIKAPSQPKCIARIHLYSDMWKHFDRGLYKFLIRYIYVPIRKSNRCFGKLFASFLCFTFVFIWHGIQMNIFIWALLNFIGIHLRLLSVCGLIRTLIENARKYNKYENIYYQMVKYFVMRELLLFHIMIISSLFNIGKQKNNDSLCYYTFLGMLVATSKSEVKIFEYLQTSINRLSTSPPCLKTALDSPIFAFIYSCIINKIRFVQEHFTISKLYPVI